jgi:hypothetical protein
MNRRTDRPLEGEAAEVAARLDRLNLQGAARAAEARGDYETARSIKTSLLVGETSHPAAGPPSPKPPDPSNVDGGGHVDQDADDAPGDWNLGRRGRPMKPPTTTAELVADAERKGDFEAARRLKSAMIADALLDRSAAARRFNRETR